MNKDPIDLELHEFILQSIDNGCNCILIGEKHLASKNSMEALAEIASVLRQTMYETGRKIIILSESFSATSQKSQANIKKMIQKMQVIHQY
ncbi:hypothetical protein [Legionella tunisiensis]|uniref:hypothetical protein n=1 Tax=Legionella tunisiensis TaxID=1034944 RepID=UPI00037F5AFA|nr:hypothetical protein [Legionella tunisiensis]